MRISGIRDARWRPGLMAGLVLAGILCAAEAKGPPEEISGVLVREVQGVSVTSDFEGGRLQDFQAEGGGVFTAVVAPEWRPMNNQQAWYAFRLSAPEKRRIRVQLAYTDGKKHLFSPKISRDRVHWEPLPKEAYRFPRGGDKASLELEIGPEPLWVSAQELFTEGDFDRWITALTEHPFVRTAEIGTSTRGRPIRKVELAGAPAGAPVVIVLGRQHPPEVTGTLGLVAFVETLAGDTELARNFRSKFHVLIIPLANPDGVNGGHWRYNVNGVDLNRDWGTFAQKETRVMRDEILRARKTAQGRVPFFIDFHSTLKDVFYTSPAVKSPVADDKLGEQDRFVRRWLDRVAELAPDHRVPVEVSPATREKKLNATSWMRAAGSASVTHEFAHDTDRAVIRELGAAGAVATMELLLGQPETAAGE